MSSPLKRVGVPCRAFALLLLVASCARRSSFIPFVRPELLIGCQKSSVSPLATPHGLGALHVAVRERGRSGRRATVSGGARRRRSPGICRGPWAEVVTETVTVTVALRRCASVQLMRLQARAQVVELRWHARGSVGVKPLHDARQHGGQVAQPEGQERGDHHDSQDARQLPGLASHGTGLWRPRGYFAFRLRHGGKKRRLQPSRCGP